MNKQLLIVFMLLWSYNSLAQQKEFLLGFQVPVSDDIYAYTTEVANIFYLEYLYYVEKDSSKDFFESQLIKFEQEDTTYTDSGYFRSPNRRYHPVVYLSFEQAANYCEWLEDTIIKRIKENDEFEIDNFVIDARLPTIEEWIKLANNYDYSIYNNSMDDNPSASLFKRSEIKKIIKKHDIKFNVKEYRKRLNDFITENPVLMFENLKYSGEKDFLKYALNINYTWPRKINDFELKTPYDLHGNVSEMTLTKGIAKGGNWKSSVGEINLMDNVKYSKPSNSIGFRCVCKFREK